MTPTITIDRAVAEQALDALKDDQYRMVATSEGHWEYKTDLAIAALEAALAHRDEPDHETRAELAEQQAKPQGCDHCNHPLYAATKCRVCGRVTEQAEPVEQKDAARWRFLIDNSFDKENVVQFHVWEHSWEPHSQTGELTEWKQRVRGPALNRFIDCAIERAHGITGDPK